MDGQSVHKCVGAHVLGRGCFVTATYSNMFQNLWLIIVFAIVCNISDINLSFHIQVWPRLT